MEREEAVELPAASRSLMSVPGSIPEALVAIKVNTPESVSAYALEESVPAGWEVASVDHDGSYQATEGKLRWGPFFDHEERVLSYTLRSVSAAPGAAFQGALSADGVSVEVTGQTEWLPAGGFRFGGGMTMSADGFRVSLEGEPGRSYRIETSVDLVEWTLWLETAAGPDGRLELHDADAAANARFYRARAR